MGAMSFLHRLHTVMVHAPVRPIVMPSVLAAPPGAVGITLRPMSDRDLPEWNAVRQGNREWLEPWESGDPERAAGMTFAEWIERQRQDERQGAAAQFLIEYQMRIVGQISVGAISYGAMRSGIVGYWVSRDAIGHGIAPMAVALLADWALLDEAGPRLHRIEIAILPENRRSLRVAQKLESHHEGLRTKYMFVRGAWRDHETYSLLADDAPEGFAVRLMRRHARE
ncbi:GNAT family N-acetyltransferase [Bifidobacterium mongoliense]